MPEIALKEEPTFHQFAPLLRAAGELDAEARCDDTRSRKPLLATLVLAGLRVGEALALCWQDVDLAMGRLRVEGAKTDAGVRVVDLSPDLRDYLATHKAGSRFGQSDDLVFPDAAVPYVMEQLGHADPKVTLSIYTHVLECKRDHGKRLDALVRGADWAPMGTSGPNEESADADFQCPRQDSNLRPAA